MFFSCIVVLLHILTVKYYYTWPISTTALVTKSDVVGFFFFCFSFAHNDSLPAWSARQVFLECWMCRRRCLVLSCEKMVWLNFFRNIRQDYLPRLNIQGGVWIDFDLRSLRIFTGFKMTFCLHLFLNCQLLWYTNHILKKNHSVAIYLNNLMYCVFKKANKQFFVKIGISCDCVPATRLCQLTSFRVDDVKSKRLYV